MGNIELHRQHNKRKRELKKEKVQKDKPTMIFVTKELEGLLTLP